VKLLRPELFGQRPACVLLDLDNTLYPYEPSHAAGTAAAQALALETLNLGPEDFARCFSDARAEIKARLGDQAASHHRLLYFQRTLERAGLASRPLEALQLEQAYWRAYLDTMRLFPGVLEFFDDLRLADVPVVVVTDLTAQIQFRKLIALELDSKIAFVVTSEESGHDKPHPAGFELALAKLGGVEGPVWMVGDNHDCDLAGAKAALGALTLEFHHAGAFKPASACPSADGRFSSFRDLSLLLSRQRGP
jgi:HAD superfamily hydrolase (TIGR01549 family)